MKPTKDDVDEAYENGMAHGIRRGRQEGMVLCIDIVEQEHERAPLGSKAPYLIILGILQTRLRRERR